MERPQHHVRCGGINLGGMPHCLVECQCPCHLETADLGALVADLTGQLSPYRHVMTEGLDGRRRAMLSEVYERRERTG